MESLNSVSVKERILNIGLDLAGAGLEGLVFLVVRDAELEEARVTPLGSPRVLYQPVTLTLLGVLHRSVTNNCNCMVNCGLRVGAFAVLLTEDTVLVAHEALRVRVHGNTNGTNRY